MTTRLFRPIAAPAVMAVAVFALSAQVPTHAATATFTNDSCESFTFADLGSGRYSVLCNLKSVPICSIKPSSANPLVGSTLTLNAECGGHPFGWLWTGPAAACSTYSSVCTDTQSVAGSKTYTVYGGNAVGQGPVAEITVNWTAVAANPPTGCAVTRTAPSSGTLPQAGGAVQLNGTCGGGGTVTSWEWRKNGTAVANKTTSQYDETLPANSGSAAITYSYEARACAGAGNCSNWTTPSTTVSVAGTTVVAGLCSAYSNVVIVDFPWGTTIDTRIPAPGLTADTVFVGRIDVPTDVGSTSLGQVRFYEYIDPEALRLISVSTQPCDFRGFVPGAALPTDPSGQNYPLSWSAGISPKVTVQGDNGTNVNYPKLNRGARYYVNLRNVSPYSGQLTCAPGTTCNGRFATDWPR